MLKTRVIPCLLVKSNALVKTVGFKKPTYVGDPLNAIRIYNEKEVDELIVLDITATIENKPPPIKLIEDIAGECFMPFTYGGGIRNMDDVKQIFTLGVEKISINAIAYEKPELLTEISKLYGSQAVIVSIDVKKDFWGKRKVFIRGGKKNTKMDPVDYAKRVEDLGAGEILLYSIERDGTFEGYDIELIKSVTDAVSIPVIVCGGAGKIEDFGTAVREGGASAVAAGSMVVFQGPNRAVLINFPTKDELRNVLV
ncbi:MAG: imidazole glycerol phosphate synthase subunit HisF [Bacteroidetes bacterium]|nr:imidazole glycerol phosphate synthase subunit HisF [Bacteroidota bacterium]